MSTASLAGKRTSADTHTYPLIVFLPILSMDFYDVIKERHSAREYKEKEIEPEKLRRVLAAVQKAPSAGNLQSYKIYLVKTKEKKEAIARAALDQDFLAQAPVVLVFCADKTGSEERYGDRGAQLYSLQDATIAAAYSQLAATAEGLSLHR